MEESVKQRLIELEGLIGYTFANRRLLYAALVHRSYRFENDDVEVDNQRLEFLGDAALGLIAAHKVFERFTDCQEGVLTGLRSAVTSGSTLAEVGESIRLGEFLFLGRGEELSGGRERAGNMADALESVLGAAYLDGGLDAVSAVVDCCFSDVLDNLSTRDVVDVNPKGRLQEYAQSLKQELEYRLIEEEGPPHEKEYTIAVYLADKQLAIARGPSKQSAGIEAARVALEQLEETTQNDQDTR